MELVLIVGNFIHLTYICYIKYIYIEDTYISLYVCIKRLYCELKLFW